MKLYAASSIDDGKLNLRNLYKTEDQFLRCYTGRGNMAEIEVFAVDQLTNKHSDAKSDYNGSALKPEDYKLLRINCQRLVLINPYEAEYISEDIIKYKPAESYDSFLKSTELVAGIRHLLTDYCRPMGGSWLGFIIHPNRHHKPKAAAMAEGLADKDPQAARTYLNEKRVELLASGANREGSLIRRIEFAIARLDEKQRLDAEAAAQAAAASRPLMV
jgi:hypothetical protein